MKGSLFGWRNCVFGARIRFVLLTQIVATEGSIIDRLASRNETLATYESGLNLYRERSGVPGPSGRILE